MKTSRTKRMEKIDLSNAFPADPIDVGDSTAEQMTERFVEEYSTDDDGVEMERVLMLYNNGTDHDRRLINDIFTCVCGWTLKTLAEETVYEDAENDTYSG